MSALFIEDDCGNYVAAPHESIMTAARHIRESSWQPGNRFRFKNTNASIDFVSMQFLDCLDIEIFSAVFLDTHFRFIAYEELSRGTINEAAIYPREVVKSAIKHGAVYVVFAHNHPSGSTAPSQADQDITRRLAQALALIDCRVLDHIIVGLEPAFAFSKTLPYVLR